jgi:protein tyrosine/serine phosphatase
LISKAKTRAEVYGIILDHYPDAMADVFRAIAIAQPGGIVIHCHGGTDRTGIVSALLLRLAGVPAETIAADYALSQERFRALNKQAEAETGDEDNVDFWARPTITPEMMNILLAHVDRKYGSVEQYMATAGVSPGDIERLKSRIRV